MGHNTAPPNQQVKRFTLEPDEPQRLANLYGHVDEHLKLIENSLKVKIYVRGNQFQISGTEGLDAAVKVIQRLFQESLDGTEITPEIVHLYLSEIDVEIAHQEKQQNSMDNLPKEDLNDSSPLSDDESTQSNSDSSSASLEIKTPNLLIRPRGPNQQNYVKTIQSHDINFSIGPAGTGKTYLAVACAVQALQQDAVQRILLVRPAVEAGEKLGFLPGDLSQKIDPYLRPLYDALYEMLGFDQVTKLIERNVIEVAPLAYMRGRTLRNSYIILDESQNTTPEQMKMFLTRIGFGSTAVITGDVTQVDLPRGTLSGLKHVLHVLDGVKGIGFSHFDSKDVVRHKLVQRIVDAYANYDTKNPNTSSDTTTSGKKPPGKENG